MKWFHSDFVLGEHTCAGKIHSKYLLIFQHNFLQSTSHLIILIFKEHLHRTINTGVIRIQNNGLSASINIKVILITFVFSTSCVSVALLLRYWLCIFEKRKQKALHRRNFLTFLTRASEGQPTFATDSAGGRTNFQVGTCGCDENKSYYCR